MDDLDNIYNLDCDTVFKKLDSNSNGLRKSQVEARLKKYGLNSLKNEYKVSAFKIYLNQYKDFLILLLVFAMVFSAILGQMLEASAMLVIIIVNSTLSFFQEYKAEKSIESLKKVTAPTAIVIRDGKQINIKAKYLVPGDIVILEAGNIIPADGRFFETKFLKVDESSLTGESVTENKISTKIEGHHTITSQKNMGFMGTIVTYGKAKLIVTKTGMDTEFGKIAKSLNETEDNQTPLKIKLNKLAKQITYFVVLICIIVFIFGSLTGDLTFQEMIIFSIALAVSVIPASLVPIVTISLGLGVKTLADKNMIVKKLPAAEGLGSATVICTDKTGTLTKNQMSVTSVYTNNKNYLVSGIGYKPFGNLIDYNNKKQNPSQIQDLLKVAILCNDSKLVKKQNHYSIVGDPTEGALIVLGEKLGYNINTFKAQGYKKITDLPFDSNRKMMSVIYSNKVKNKTIYTSYTKGALEFVLSKSTKILSNGKIKILTETDKKKYIEQSIKYAKHGLRILSFAYKDVSKLKTYSINNVEKDLIFVGIVAMFDPPKEGVKEAVETAHRAGVKTIMITGDSLITAKAIGSEIGIFNKDDIAITGRELDDLTDKELETKLSRLTICARFLPIQKSRIVDALQKQGHIVAMTGDGVNDSPALKKADLGIAMGIGGTDVAKDVSKLILADDNFKSIVVAIEEGRNIFDKMLKSIKYLLACNLGELTTIFLAVVLKLPLPLLPLQLLMMNLLTDGLPAMGLGYEPKEKNVMNRKPRNPQSNPIEGHNLMFILLFGIIMGIGSIALFFKYLPLGWQNLTDGALFEVLKKPRTVAFTALVMFEMLVVLSAKSLYNPFYKIKFFKNKLLLLMVAISVAVQVAIIYVPLFQVVFNTVPLNIIDWFWIMGIALIAFIMMELSKIFFKPQDI